MICIIKNLILCISYLFHYHKIFASISTARFKHLQSFLDEKYFGLSCKNHIHFSLNMSHNFCDIKNITQLHSHKSPNYIYMSYYSDTSELIHHNLCILLKAIHKLNKYNCIFNKRKFNQLFWDQTNRFRTNIAFVN